MLKRRVVPSRWEAVTDGEEVDLADIAARLLDLIADDPSECVLERADRRTAVLLHKAATPTRPLRLQLLSLKDSDSRPIQFRPGSPPEDMVIDPDSFTGEATHVCIWPDGVAAQDWFTDVPRLSRLSEFLRHKLNVRVRFIPVYDESLLDQLWDIRGQMRRASLTLRQDHNPAEDQGVFGALVPAAFGAKAPSLKVELGMGRSGPRNQYLPAGVDEAVLAAAETTPEVLENLVVWGRSRKTGEMVEVNLLKNRVGADVSLQRRSDASGLPDEREAFKAIWSAVGTLRADGRLGLSGASSQKA